MHQEPASPRSTVRRHAERGNYDPAVLRAILDDGFVCHVGFVVDGQPYVIPTGYARIDDVLYLHGSPASRMLRSLREGVPVCVTVTLLDALVLARSTYHHSLNYRSVVVLGRATEVTDHDAKVRAMDALVEQIVPGRSRDARRPSDGEIKGTLILAVPLSEASAKVRTGPPIDAEADYALPIWAGVVPLRLAAGSPIDDPRLQPGLTPPEYATAYRRPGEVSQPPTSLPRVTFHGAFPIGDTDILTLPVRELGPAACYYIHVLGFSVVERTPGTILLQRDAARIGLATNGKDPEQASCYFSVSDVALLREELAEKGIEPSVLREEEHGGKRHLVFFAREPYGVCFCFGQVVASGPASE